MSTQSNPAQDVKRPLLEHLLALRKVVFVSALAVGIGFVLAFYLVVDWLLAVIMQPITARGIEVIYTAMSEALLTKMKVALVAGFVLAFPVVVWQIWAFIKPALYPNERRSFRLLFFATLLLFVIGLVFCYGCVYLLAVDFFLVAGENLAVPMLSVDKYVGFLFGFLIPFGLAFELPVVLYVTTHMGWTNYAMLASKRKYVILAVTVVAAFLTPPDVVSQVMLGIPMLILFEIGLAVCRFVKPRRQE